MSTLIRNIENNEESDNTNPIPRNIRFSDLPFGKLCAEKTIPIIDIKIPVSAIKLYNNPSLSNPKYKLSL